jgi:phosphatidylserine decarboxylase
MTSLIHSLSRQEQLNFLLTNRIPRRLATKTMGWISAIESPLLTRWLIRIWRLFADDLNLEEADKREFTSLHECFIRKLQPGARSIDMRQDIVVSPCDAIVCARGDIDGTTVFQAKGFPYDLADLIPDQEIRERYRNGKYISLRLKSSMYHRFHAPLDCEINEVTYISGDTWNVNEIALQRVEKLYCKNERAVIELDTGRAQSRICLVPVAAILVASIRLNWLNELLSLKYMGPNKIACKEKFNKGDELGYFQHGSTIILFSTPDFSFCDDAQTGERVQMGQSLLSFVSERGDETYQKSRQSNEVTT